MTGGGSRCYNPIVRMRIFITLVCLGSLLLLAGILDVVQSRWGVFSFDVPHFDPEITILALGLVILIYAVIFRPKFGDSGS